MKATQSYTKIWGNPGGFTLLEVMVAVAILGISLVLTMQLFAGTLSNISRSRRYTEATFLARHKLEEISLEDHLESGSQEGNFGEEYAAYAWWTEVSPYPLAWLPETPEAGKVSLQVFQVKLRVSWEERGKTHRVELVTLNTSIKKTETL